MSSAGRMWTVSCHTCNIVIGAVEGGRFVHNPECARPLVIGQGRLRCCQCGGALAGDPRPLAEREPDEAPAAPVPRFPPFAGCRTEARQRL